MGFRESHRSARRGVCGALFGCYCAAALAALMLLAAGCGGGGGASSLSLGDLPAMTAETVGDLLVGREYSPTSDAPPDPTLLKKGAKEKVVLAADTAGFAAQSRGSISEKALKDALKETVKILNKRLKRGGFAVEEAAAFPPAAPADPEHTLVATLTPVTEETGSPEDRANGRQRTMVLVRLTVTDPETGDILRRRDYYSGRDVKGLRERERDREANRDRGR